MILMKLGTHHMLSEEKHIRSTQKLTQKAEDAFMRLQQEGGYHILLLTVPGLKNIFSFSSPQPFRPIISLRLEAFYHIDPEKHNATASKTVAMNSDRVFPSGAS